MEYNFYEKNYNIDKNIVEYVDKTCELLNKGFKSLDKIKEYNFLKVINSFNKNNLSNTDFNWTTGYGFGDYGVFKTEKIFSDIFKTEDSLVRSSIVSGTHAISIVLFSLLNYGDNLVSITGDPYDTLQQVIGIKGKEKGNLISKGINYSKLDLDDYGKIQYNKIKDYVKKAKLVAIQRSTGYTNRRAFTIDEIEKAIKIIRKSNQNAIIFVDNCYGEFTQTREPSEVGADIIAGSLIKNIGSGIALTGGYITGNKNLIEYCSNYLTSPGIGKEEGLSFGTTRNVLQGLYFSPMTTIESVKIAMLFSKCFNDLGYKVSPLPEDERSDIVESIVLKSPEKVIEFCKAIQESCTLDSNIIPEPSPMPGYEDEIIMSAGGFIDGSTGELSADGPLRKPYTVYVQGGLNFIQGKLAIMKVLQKFSDKNFIDLNKLTK
ncbi:MAG: methionine gamma-lyase family protein [Peptoniphilaceae bacterium]|nr:methionine gamma-lyase family protein [Peptoniphilaceae bacterium]